jgi:hypothetical protein
MQGNCTAPIDITVSSGVQNTGNMCTLLVRPASLLSHFTLPHVLAKRLSTEQSTESVRITVWQMLLAQQAALIPAT